MCGGGGGDGGASAERARQEKAEQERIAAIRGINTQFDDPRQQAMRAAFGEDVYGLNKTKLDEEQENRARDRKFALARRGLTGGSQDAFTAGEMSEDYLEALTGIQRHAEGREQDLRSADERARSNLVSQANAGLDPTSAAQLALNAVATNLGTAKNENLYADLGQFMTSLSLGSEAEQKRVGGAAARRLYDEDPYAVYRPGQGGGQITSLG